MFITFEMDVLTSKFFQSMIYKVIELISIVDTATCFSASVQEHETKNLNRSEHISRDTYGHVQWRRNIVNVGGYMIGFRLVIDLSH